MLWTVLDWGLRRVSGAVDSDPPKHSNTSQEATPPVTHLRASMTAQDDSRQPSLSPSAQPSTPTGSSTKLDASVDQTASHVAEAKAARGPSSLIFAAEPSLAKLPVELLL